MTRAFPHLFPTGQGDYSMARFRKVDLGDYLRHLIRFHDPRFREDERYLYFAMNTMMRWRALASGRVFLRQHPAEAAMSADQIKELMKNPVFMRMLLA